MAAMHYETAALRVPWLGAPLPGAGVQVRSGRSDAENSIQHSVRCARRGAPVADANRAANGGKRARRQPKQESEEVLDEEIFTLAGGWKVDPYTLASPEALASIGAVLPARTKRQLEKGQKKEPAAVTNEKPTERLTHRMLRIMAGSQGGRRLLSPADQAVRPMMEMVRGAVFSMLQAMAGMPSSLPGGRWLDLYSGTGSVGIEALSRGCKEAHFVEADPWVVAEVLGPNLATCSLTQQTMVHTTRVEQFLQRGEQSGAEYAGGCFDYVSVTPPYEAVVFSELMAQLGRSPFINPDTCMIVEYPLRSKHELPDLCGPLVKIRDRRYGRTHLAIYGPKWAKDDGE